MEAFAPPICFSIPGILNPLELIVCKEARIAYVHNSFVGYVGFCNLALTFRFELSPFLPKVFCTLPPIAPSSLNLFSASAKPSFNLVL